MVRSLYIAKKRSGYACLVTLLFTMALACLGCKAPPVWEREDPDVVLRGFLQSADAERTDLVWNYLSKNTRDILQKKADEFNQISKTERPAHEMIRFGHVMSSTREYKKLDVENENDLEAVVNIVKHDDSTIQVVLKKEDGHWTIDLPLERQE